MTVQWIITGGLKQKHKKQPFGDATDLAGEVGGIAKRIKTVRLRRKTNLQKSEYPKTRTKRGSNALYVLECDDLYLCQMINIQCVISIIGGREISRPYQNVGYRLENLMQFFTEESLYHQGVFAVKRRAVFILGAMW